MNYFNPRLSLAFFLIHVIRYFNRQLYKFCILQLYKHCWLLEHMRSPAKQTLILMSAKHLQTYFVNLVWVWQNFTRVTRLLVPIKTLVVVDPDATVHRCSVKKVFLKISQNSQENTCARVSLLIKFQAY